MNKVDLVRKMINHMQRGEDALWLADEFQMDVPDQGDLELAESVRLLLEGSERLYNRLYELNDELELGEDLSI